MLGIQKLDDALKPGVYLLTWRGRVVYVGQARCLVTAVSMHRAATGMPVSAFSPVKRVQFDGVQIIPCDLARAAKLLPGLIELYDPIANRPAPELPAGAAGHSPVPSPTVAHPP